LKQSSLQHPAIGRDQVKIREKSLSGAVLPGWEIMAGRKAKMPAPA